MRPKQRQLKIIDMLRRTGRVNVDELTTEFNASAETIRRDLSVLAHSGKIQKVHGGALLPSNQQGEGPFQQRMAENIAAKRIIAEKASKLISAGDTLLIDTGSTTLIFAEEIAAIKDLTVITNSAEIAKIIATVENNSTVFLLGGKYNSDNRQTLGAMLIAQLEQFHVQHTVLTVGSLNAQVGAADFNAEEAIVARAMLQRAKNSILLVDSSKFNSAGSFVVGKLEKFDQLVCDMEPDHVLKMALKEAKVALI
ncbi:MAG: DeoR/GlpR transcriptional regulator [Cocleimonas sp.]|nr:DeoR/GlpR transcriptional regulator [Cocleimonas sp.]